MNGEYRILLDKKLIGSTDLEYGDAPMGVVWGKIHKLQKDFGYQFIIDFCESNKVELADHFPDDKFVSTRTIPTLEILNELGIEIRGIGNQIRCLDGEIFEIEIDGIPHPDYEDLFPHHVREYEDRFNK